MGFKNWVKEGVKEAWHDGTKEKVELRIIAGSELLNDKFPGGFKKTNMLKLGKGKVKIIIPTGKNITAHLKDIEWEEQAKRSLGKGIGGTVAGGLVAGPLGAAAGAAIGGRRRDQSSAFVYLVPEGAEEETVLHIECDKKEYQQISSFRG